MANTLEGMTKQELLARREQDETRMAELDPKRQGSPVDGSGIAHRHSRYLNEYQNLEAEVAEIDTLLKSK
jgi:hypothetical protein